MLLLMFETVCGWLPAPLHRAVLRRAHAARTLWWRLRKPRIEGSRVLALNAAGQVLLVRHSYGSPRWMPPGGGIKPGEDVVLSAAREFAEEIGGVLQEARIIDVIEDTLHGAGNRVHVVLGRCDTEPQPDGREIIEARWFDRAALPSDMARGLDTALPRWLAAASD